MICIPRKLNGKIREDFNPPNVRQQDSNDSRTDARLLPALAVKGDTISAPADKPLEAGVLNPIQLLSRRPLNLQAFRRKRIELICLVCH